MDLEDLRGKGANRKLGVPFRMEQVGEQLWGHIILEPLSRLA